MQLEKLVLSEEEEEQRKTPTSKNSLDFFGEPQTG